MKLFEQTIILRDRPKNPIKKIPTFTKDPTYIFENSSVLTN